jgi:hypothetical protein
MPHVRCASATCFPTACLQSTDEQPSATAARTSLGSGHLQPTAHDLVPVSDSQLELDWLPAADATTTTPPAVQPIMQGTIRDTIHPVHHSPAPAAGMHKRRQVTDATTAPSEGGAVLQAPPQHSPHCLQGLAAGAGVSSQAR